jgi:hypothetical protein
VESPGVILEKLTVHIDNNCEMRFEVLVALSIKITVFWNVVSYEDG